jgi:hypothetical protein
VKVSVGIALLQALRSYVVGFALWLLVVYVATPDVALRGFRENAEGIGLLALFFVLTQLGRVLWPMRIPRRKLGRLVAGGRSYAVHSYTGQVGSIMKLPITEINATTQTTVSYDPSLSYGNATSRLSVRSRTRMFDQFTLTAADGSQRSFQVIDANLALGNGQTISVAWALRPLSRRGRYLVFVNHTADSVSYQGDDLVRLALGTRWGFVALAAIVMGIALAIGLSPLWLLCLIGWPIAFRLLITVKIGLFSAGSCKHLVAALNEVAASSTAQTRAPQIVSAPAVPALGPAYRPPAAPAGWLPDPTERLELRFWDGGRWTEHVTDAGAPAVDPA